MVSIQKRLPSSASAKKGKRYLMVAIDCDLKYAYVKLHETKSRMTARDCLTYLIAAVPYSIHTVLTITTLRLLKFN